MEFSTVPTVAQTNFASNKWLTAVCHFNELLINFVMNLLGGVLFECLFGLNVWSIYDSLWE